MQRIIYFLGSLVIVILCCSFTMSGYYYFTVNSNIGTKTIVIPPGNANVFTIDSDTGFPVNLSSNSITAYTLDADGVRDYRVTIAPYGEQWTYRSMDSNYTTADFNVTELLDTNIDFITTESIGRDVIDVWVILFGLIGFVILVIYFRGR